MGIVHAVPEEASPATWKGGINTAAALLEMSPGASQAGIGLT